jgi:predicted ATPase
MLENERRWQDILEWAERWISMAQAPEAAYRSLMVAYDALGDHPKVVSTYERYKRALRQLDLEPSEQIRAVAFKRSSKLHIPIPLTSLIGREKELEEIAKLFSKSRLITLTGSGGVGKTRLAIQVVSDVLELFPDGVWFLDLAPLGDPALVPNTLGKVLDLQLVGGSDLSITDLIADYLCSRTTLLIFDNCEHLIDGCASLVEFLLKSCEGLHILATSREMLRVPGEITYRVPSLVIPPEQSNMDTLVEFESVQLFVERAKTILPSFELLKNHALSIAQICRRLDGIPLALELAAARVEMLSVVQIAGHLDDCFRLLTRGARTVLPRHQTMRAVIDWSYNLLSNEEKSVLTGLSIFVGGWTLEAAEAVCETANILDLLTYLVDKSLVAVNYENGNEPRYYLLETIRQYALEKLTDSGERERICKRHLNYFLKLAQRAEPELYGAGQVEWSQRLIAEHENMRTALEWSLKGDVIIGQELAASLWWSWSFNGYLSEGYDWLIEMLTVNPMQNTLIRAKLLSGAGWLAAMLGHIDQSKKYSEDSVALFRELSNDAGSAFPLGTLGVLAYWRADYEPALQLMEQSLELFKIRENKWGVRHISTALGYLAEAQGDLKKAQKFFDESLSISNEIGDHEGKGYVLYRMGLMAASQGDDTQAIEIFEEGLKNVRLAGGKIVTSWILEAMGITLLQRADYNRSQMLFEEAFEINRKLGDWLGVSNLLSALGRCARLQGDYLKARSFYCNGLQLRKQSSDQKYDDKYMAGYLIDIGVLLGVQGDPEKFTRLLGLAKGLFPEIIETFIPFSRTETKQYIETARATLGDEAYIAAYEAGKRMSLEEAVDYVLNELR